MKGRSGRLGGLVNEYKDQCTHGHSEKAGNIGRRFVEQVSVPKFNKKRYQLAGKRRTRDLG